VAACAHTERKMPITISKSQFMPGVQCLKRRSDPVRMLVRETSKPVVVKKGCRRGRKWLIRLDSNRVAALVHNVHLIDQRRLYQILGSTALRLKSKRQSNHTIDKLNPQPA